MVVPMALTVTPLFSDHMVVQRDRPALIWGSAAAHATVTITLADAGITAQADAAGAWRAHLPAMPAGGSHTLRIASGNENIILRDVLIGDVWLCAGQSNMEWPLQQSSDGAAATAAATCPRLRLFSVPRAVGDTATSVALQGAWKECTPETAASFSAVGYFFARAVQEQLDVPIGLINNAVGGSSAQAWTPLSYLEERPATAGLAIALRAALAAHPETQNLISKGVQMFGEVTYHKDTGNEGVAQGFADPAHDMAAWQPMPVPSYWQQHGLLINGAVWFRRTVTVPPRWHGRALRLQLGAVDDFDVTYFNGVEVGAAPKDDANAYARLRDYRIAPELVREGENVIAVRVFDHFGNGGLCGKREHLRLCCEEAPADFIPLEGTWHYRVERAIPLPAASPLNALSCPSGLYNGMLAPLLPFAICGVIWYQGESNGSDGWQYRVLLPTMIQAWRDAWGQGDFPFLIVQLANFQQAPIEPCNDNWAELREAQTYTARTVANAAQAIAIDIGDADDIHPRNKCEVGRRLALLALKRVYGRACVDQGPAFQSMIIADGCARLQFSHCAEGLTTQDGLPPRSFAIAGADRKFKWAAARIDGTTVLVSHPDVPAPVAVRYAWAANPQSNLCNFHGLPAEPFRTDCWPGMSER
jgi:sialate O-acetylesterase